MPSTDSQLANSPNNLARNREVAGFLGTIADLLEIKGEQEYRVRAYREAAQQVAGLKEDIGALHSGGRLTDIRGVGPSISAKIDELLRTGRSGYLASLNESIPPGLVALLGVPGLSLQRARAIYEQLGLKSVDELFEAAASGRLRSVPGIGAKTEKRLAESLHAARLTAPRYLLSTALPLAQQVIGRLSESGVALQVALVGSARRMVETVGNVDLVLASDEPKQALDVFASLPQFAEVLERTSVHAIARSWDRVPVTLRVVEPSAFGAAVLYYTGSIAHNQALNVLAKEHGFIIEPQSGLVRLGDGRPIAGASEKDVYAALGLPWLPPELREDRGELEAAISGQLPDLIEESDLRGDLHVHSDFSDGSATVEAMAVAAIERGFEYIAVTDHSVSLRVAGGMTIERVREQRRLIDRLNQKYAPFRILAGVEVEIKGDGSLDYPLEVLREFDVVSASLHQARGQDSNRATERMLKAVRHPLVDIINHPSGRILGRREPYSVDLARVIEAAALSGTALEINASPDRLDLNDRFAARAIAAGVALTISTDAHSPAQYEFARYGIAQARRAWVEPRHVLNALPLSSLLGRFGRDGRAA